MTEASRITPDTAQHKLFAHIRQVIAYNLATARKQRGWDQAQMCTRLREASGLDWSTANLSAAESGWDSKTGRVRHFEAVELVAFALALDVPVTLFLSPPPLDREGREVEGDQPWLVVSTDGDATRAISSTQLASLLTARRPDLRIEESVFEVKSATSSGAQPPVSYVSLDAIRPLFEQLNALFQAQGGEHDTREEPE